MVALDVGKALLYRLYEAATIVSIYEKFKNI
jgi:hypothetical protein